MATVKSREIMYELEELESLLNPCIRLNTQLHPVLEPEVGSRIEYEYSVTIVATKVAWYSPCVIWGRVGAIENSYGGRI